MIQKMQEYIYQIVQRPEEKTCNADRLSRRPNEKPEWKDGEKEELIGKTPKCKPWKRHAVVLKTI